MEPLAFTFQTAQGLDSLPAARDIRSAVFVREQGFTHEFDEIDGHALHVLALDGDKPVATGRTFPQSAGATRYIIGRVAVLPAYRGHGAGRAVVGRLEELARSRGADTAVLSAQLHARGFYETLGYRAEGEEDLDEHCPHITMTKKL